MKMKRREGMLQKKHSCLQKVLSLPETWNRGFLGMSFSSPFMLFLRVSLLSSSSLTEDAKEKKRSFIKLTEWEPSSPANFC